MKFKWIGRVILWLVKWYFGQNLKEVESHLHESNAEIFKQSRLLEQARALIYAVDKGAATNQSPEWKTLSESWKKEYVDI